MHIDMGRMLIEVLKPTETYGQGPRRLGTETSEEIRRWTRWENLILQTVMESTKREQHTMFTDTHPIKTWSLIAAAPEMPSKAETFQAGHNIASADPGLGPYYMPFGNQTLTSTPGFPLRGRVASFYMVQCRACCFPLSSTILMRHRGGSGDA
jgi:hypothetical protein